MELCRVISTLILYFFLESLVDFVMDRMWCAISPFQVDQLPEMYIRVTIEFDKWK
jgi:hypothetical protein